MDNAEKIVRGEDYIYHLKIASERLSVLQGLLQTEDQRLKAEISLVSKAREEVDNSIYELTGDIFYLDKEVG